MAPKLIKKWIEILSDFWVAPRGGLGRQQGTTRPLSERPKGGPRPLFGHALASKTGPELPQEGPGAKLTKSPSKLTKLGLFFLLIWVRFL